MLTVTKDNSVPNQIQPRNNQGFMIRCTNDWRYYGESQNVSGRLASHRSLLNHKFIPIICCKLTIQIWNQPFFEYIVLSWDQSGTIHYSKEKNDYYSRPRPLLHIGETQAKQILWGQSSHSWNKKKISFNWENLTLC
jgi:hypothetical protein